MTNAIFLMNMLHTADGVILLLEFFLFFTGKRCISYDLRISFCLIIVVGNASLNSIHGGLTQPGVATGS